MLALLPALILSLFLGYHLINSRLDDMQTAIQKRGSLLARQLALTSESSLYWGNHEMLDNLVNGIAFNKDVLWAAILDNDRQLVTASTLLFKNEYSGFFSELRSADDDVFYIPIGVLKPDLSSESDAYLVEFALSKKKTDTWPLGWAVIRLSMDELETKRNQIFLISFFYIAGGLLFTVLLAAVVGKSITRPIMRLDQTVHKVRNGDLSVRLEQIFPGELGQLEAGFNEMTESLELAQGVLSRQVDKATSKLNETINKLKLNNKELERAQQEALKASREKSEFLARMSHEIRTPLNAVIGFSRLLHKEKSVSDVKEYSSVINITATQLLKLIDDILNFSRLDSGNVELEKQEFNLVSTLENVVAMMVTEAHLKKLSLIFHPHADLPQTIIGDAVRLNQIVTNLVNNAIKFTEQGHVLIEAQTLEQDNQHWIQLTIADTGIGFDTEKSSLLFEKFKQADNSISRRFGGSGLGLSIAYQLVRLMLGEISVNSTPGAGTVFTIKLPLETSGIKSPINDELDLTGQAICIFDQNAVSRRVIRSQLGQMGASVNHFGEIDRLLGFLQQPGMPDLLVLSLGYEQSEYQNLRNIKLQIRQYFDGQVLVLLERLPEHTQVLALSDDNFSMLDKPATQQFFKMELNKSLFGNKAEQEEMQLQANKHPQRGVKVLSAEDNEFNRLLLRKLMQARGITLYEATSGEEALDFIQDQNEQFDLILLDIHMPEKDGIQTAKEIRQKLLGHCPPIISLSADVFAQTKGESFQVFDESLLKPLQETELDRVLLKWVDDYSIDESIASDSETVSPSLSQPLFEEARRLFKQLDTHLKASELNQAAETAHQLKGMVGLFGNGLMLTVIKRIEAVLKQGQQDGLETMLEEFERLLGTVSM